MTEEALLCPYRWASITMLIDASAGSQRYVEDCEVCCHPIDVRVAVGVDDSVSVELDRTP